MKESPTTPTGVPLLMRSSPAELREKLCDPSSPLAPWWQHFVTLAREDPVWFSPYTVLAAVVTGLPADRSLARDAFLRFVELRDEGEISNEAQYHTHVISAPLGRWAIFYDWVADLELFSPAEDAAIREMLLDYASIFSLQQIQSRYLGFDNQALANAFGAASVGYVLGVKRGDSAAARRLYSSGIAWLRALLGRLPAGGYSPEGSTYHAQVVQPLTLLSALLLEETTGDSVMDNGLPPANLPVRDLLVTSSRLIGPGGLLPAWDHYGYQAATIKSGLVYLARLTGDPQPLAVLRACNMWYRTAHPAWEMDDRLWTFVWWPAEIDGMEEAAFPSWMVPEVGGALQEPAGKIRLFQYWDECGGVLNSGRCHVDPNAITLEAFQSPVLLDGHGSLGPELVPLPPDTILDYIGRRRIETVNEYILSSWGGTPTQEETIAIAMAGSVGQSNSVVLNGESWYVPLGPRSGRGQALHRAGPLQAIRSDATEYYTDRYSLSRITRSTILVGGKYVLVSDRVIADTPHEVTWQAFVREKAKIEGNRLVIETAEQVRCDLVPLQPGTLELTPAKDYPIGPAEGRSVRVQHTLPAATDTRIDVAMVPQHCLAPLADLTDGWERELSGHRDAVSLATAYLSDPATDPDTPRIFRRQITIRRNPDIRHFLVVEIASVLLEVNVNGLRVSATTTHPQGIWSESATFLPWVFDITEALRDGDNEILLRAPFFHGETICGPIRLCIEQDPLPVDFVRAGADTFAATVGEETDQIVMDRTGGVAPWAGGETDARYAVLLMNGTVAACDVTALSLPSGFRLQSSAPCDVYWAQLETALTSFVDGGSVEIVWAQGQLSLEISGCVNVTYSGDGAHSLTLHLPAARTVLVNGGVVGRRGGGASPTVTIELTPSAEICSVPTSAEEVYALAERCGAVSGDALVEALSGDDWRVQMAAADVIGRLRIARAVPLLLQRFAEAEAELPYPALTKWWRASKMLRGDYEEGPDPALPLPLAVKRWRVKRAVVTALGKLGDRRAVEPLEAALARCDDFFPVTSQLAVALGRLGSPNSVSVLERHAEHAEINLRVHARLSLALLKGEIDRRTFETRVGAG